MKKLLYISALYLCCFACADLEELAPINSIPTDQAITDRASAQAALTGVYDGLQESDFDRWLSLAQYFSDEANATGTFLSRLEFGNLNVFPANTTMGTVFTEIYENINEANNVIDLVPKVEDDGFSQAERDDIVGQAKGIPKAILTDVDSACHI